MEGALRLREVQMARIELWKRNTGEITFSEILRHYVGNRKKGHIFINGRTGNRLTPGHFEKMIDKWARLLNIQRSQSISSSSSSSSTVWSLSYQNTSFLFVFTRDFEFFKYVLDGFLYILHI